MAMTAADVMKMIKEKEVKFVDLRFTDTRGKEQHVSVPVKAFGMDKFEAGTCCINACASAGSRAPA